MFRVGRKKLGSAGEPETHNWFILALLKKRGGYKHDKLTVQFEENGDGVPGQF